MWSIFAKIKYLKVNKIIHNLASHITTYRLSSADSSGTSIQIWKFTWWKSTYLCQSHCLFYGYFILHPLRWSLITLISPDRVFCLVFGYERIFLGRFYHHLIRLTFQREFRRFESLNNQLIWLLFQREFRRLKSLNNQLIWLLFQRGFRHFEVTFEVTYQ